MIDDLTHRTCDGRQPDLGARPSHPTSSPLVICRGLMRADAEMLLDALEASGATDQELYLDGSHFTVRYRCPQHVPSTDGSGKEPIRR